MSKLNWANRHGPDEFDNTAPTRPTYQFDLRRNVTPGGTSWPEKLQGEKFGPSFIGRAWKAGLVVVAEVEGCPHPVAAVESRWGAAGVLQVKVSGCWVVPDRLFTRSSVKGMDATGLLIEGGDK